MTALKKDYSKCVMVTGGTGFIGSHIAEELLKGADGSCSSCRQVIVYDIFDSTAHISVEQKYNLTILKETAKKYGTTLTIVEGDLRDQHKIIETIKKYVVTACIHVGGMVDDRKSVTNLEEYIDINIRGTALLLDALGKCGVDMVVQASNKSVFGEWKNDGGKLDEDADRKPLDPAGACKVGADAMAHCYSHLHNMNLTLVRVFGAYGPRGRPDMMPRILIENLIDGEPIKKFGDGTATRTWTYISDIVSAFIMALENPQSGFAEFNTGAPSSTTLNEMIACAEKVTGKTAIIQQYSVPLGDIHTYGHPSYARIENVIGWTPTVDIMEGMRLTYEAYMAKRKSAMVNTGCFGN